MEKTSLNPSLETEMIEPGNQALTFNQKMEAIAFKYYCKSTPDWTPKGGDHYTIVRNDLNLFRIIGEEKGEFVCWLIGATECNFRFPVAGFTTEEFGPNRVHVPDWIFERVQ